MTNEQLAALIGTIILGNILVIWKIISFAFKKIHEYLNLLTRVENLERIQQKHSQDINGIGKKLRNDKP